MKSKESSETIKTVFDIDFQVEASDNEYQYQEELTNKLDKTIDLFDQNIINEIVLWKVNRYAALTDEILNLINTISPDDKELDKSLTRNILGKLLKCSGIQLPMASTILRFKNPKIYQIIDQRVYRIITPGNKLKLKSFQNEKNIQESIDLYLDYLDRLRSICNELSIPFEQSDRILYEADKRVNMKATLDNY